MVLEKDKYFNIKKLGDESLRIAELLILSYPVSKACFEILGKRLLNSLEVGIFSPGTKIIRQGEKGKDLYLLCNNYVDVYVNQQKILQIAAPGLLGDKGIVEPKSERAATITISPKAPCLFIKIPMGTFLRDYKDTSIQDKSFLQEQKIYLQLFKEIQERLFHYAYLQKQLWEEAKTALNGLNIQLISCKIDTSKDLKWDKKIWAHITHYLLKFHRFRWPKDVPQNPQNFRNLYYSFLEKTISKKLGNITSSKVETQKQLIWQKWLHNLGEYLVKKIPSDELPVNIGVLELFNPRNYQMKLQILLKSIEKNFILKKAILKTETVNPSKLRVSNFFGNSVDSNDFDLNGYLKTFKDIFILKNSERILAQISQRIAHVAAQCENDFNLSVSQMRQFLEKIEKSSVVQKSDTQEKTDVTKIIDRCTAGIGTGFRSFEKKMVGNVQTHVGSAHVSPSTTPIILELIKACGTDRNRKSVKLSYDKLLEVFKINKIGVGEDILSKLIHICEIYPDHNVPEKEFVAHYWIPVSSKIQLKKGDNNYGEISTGSIIGGPGWSLDKTLDQSKLFKSQKWQLKSPQRKPGDKADSSFLLFVLPTNKLPWSLNKNPLPDELEAVYLPLIRWFINNLLGQIRQKIEIEKILHSQFQDMIEMVALESTVRDFERNESPVEEGILTEIQNIIFLTLGFKLDIGSKISTSAISKLAYNRILQQTKRDFPKRSIEERGNKAYTLWRYLLSELVSNVDVTVTKPVKMELPKDHIASINREIDQLLQEFIDQEEIAEPHLRKEDKALNIQALLGKIPNKKESQKLSFLVSILSIFESHNHLIFEETFAFNMRLKEIHEIKKEFNVKELQTEYMQGLIEKLIHLINR